MWIEANFKDWKRGGLHPEHSKTRDSQRLSRLILVLAVARLHIIRLGNAVLSPNSSRSGPLRRLSLVTLGWLKLLVCTIHDSTLYTPTFSFPPKKTYP